MKNQLNWIEEATALESIGVVARSAGDEKAADAHYREAWELARRNLECLGHTATASAPLDVLFVAARLALNAGEAPEARQIMEAAVEAEASAADRAEWQQLRDITAWPDAWLIAAVRRDPPDAQALDTLAERHWKALFARCQMLTVNREKANDVAQEAWCRVLRARHALKPGGNFPAYLATIATNLWRDKCRSARRAGPLAEERLVALDAALPGEDGDSVALRDVLQDLNALPPAQQAALALDIDQALERLDPQLRDVLVARFITGESCAEIGKRYGRTEQTISSWVRAGVREMKLYLEAPSEDLVAKENS